MPMNVVGSRRDRRTRERDRAFGRAISFRRAAGARAGFADASGVLIEPRPVAGVGIPSPAPAPPLPARSGLHTCAAITRACFAGVEWVWKDSVCTRVHRR